MKKNYLYVIIYSVIISFVISCVPAKKFEDEKARRKSFEDQNKQLKTANEQLLASIKDLTGNNADLQNKIKNLVKDTAVMGSSLTRMKSEYDKINQLNNELIEKLEKQKSGNIEDQKKILTELQKTKEDLLRREDDLKKLEKVLNNREMNLNAMTEKFNANQKELEQKQKKLEELQSILTKKDSIVKALKAKVSNALLGFENKGLTVQQKNGKVYVSMEEALLFPSGSFAVNKRGAEALKKLAMVLEVNPDINVVVEGHTDNVPYKGAGQLKDNWDLSVMRATTIVKTILEGSRIDPDRLSASGRSEYSPINPNDTPDGRAKNRRTEIILTPKLDELFKIIETN
jgi:chemotaxis protein MotB